MAIGYLSCLYIPLIHAMRRLWAAVTAAFAPANQHGASSTCIRALTLHEALVPTSQRSYLFAAAATDLVIPSCMPQQFRWTSSQSGATYPHARLPPNLRLTAELERRLSAIATRCSALEQAMMQDGGRLPGSSSSSSSISGSALPAAVTDMQALQKEYGSLQGLASSWNALLRVRREAVEVEQLTDDADTELAAEARAELARLHAAARGLEEELLLGLLPTQGEDDDGRGAIVEVRAGAGGAEASLFAAELLDMYERWAAAKAWRCERLAESASEAGGVRTGSLAVSGAGAYRSLRWEAGVHRVQRVPATETQGRLHTSTASVVVLPEADEVEVMLRDADVHIEAFRSSGPGGQHVNTTSSAVRVTHLPTGMSVACQEGRSQLQNRAQALRLLRARLLDAQRQQAAASTAAERRSQAGSAERNERIRTYNFSQDRMTDHRAGITVQGLVSVMSGASSAALDGIHAALELDEQTQALETLLRQQNPG